MADTKICSTCRVPKPLTEYNTDRSKKDGLVSRCKDCIADSRSAHTRAERRAIELHKKHLEACRRALEDPNASELKRRNAERDLRLAEKHLEKILEPFNQKREAAAAAERAIKNAEQDTKDAITQTEQDRLYDLQRAEEQRLYDIQKAEEDANALAAAKEVAGIMEWCRPYLQTAHLDLKARARLKAHCETQAAKCREVLKKAVGQDAVVAKAMAQCFAHLAERLQIVTESLLSNMPEKYFLNEATQETNWTFRQVNERALLRFYTAKIYERNGLATDSLPPAPPPILNSTRPSQNLRGIEDRLEQANYSRQYLEEKEAVRQKYWSDLKISDPKRFDAESKSAILQVKGDDRLAQYQRKSLADIKRTDPEAYERMSLAALKPISFAPETVVWLVPVWEFGQVPKAKDEMWWGWGVKVRPQELFFDFLQKAWFRSPEPADVDAHFGTGNKKKECVFDEMQNKWVYRDVEEGVTYEQNDEGLYVKKKSSAANQFAKPEKITFKVGSRRDDPTRTEFRYGHFYTPAECQESAKAMVNAPLLPPLQRTVADFVATAPPLSAEELEKLDAPVLSPWQKHEIKTREQAARESEILN
jgi:hypothetical protein